MTPVQPVWWVAPSPAPLSPWKYSLNTRLSFHARIRAGAVRPARSTAGARPARRANSGSSRRRRSSAISSSVSVRAAAGRVLDLEVVAEEPAVALEGADQEVVQREPDRPAPVGVAAEHRRRRLGRLVVDRRPDALDVELVGVLAVVRRHGAQAVRRQELVARRTAWRAPSAGARRRRRRAAGAACPGSPRTSPCSVRPSRPPSVARAGGRTPCPASRRDRALARRARRRPAAG